MRRAILQVRCENVSVANAAKAENIPVRTVHRYVVMSRDPGDADFYLPPDLSTEVEDGRPGLRTWTPDDWTLIDNPLSITERNDFVLIENIFPE